MSLKVGTQQINIKKNVICSGFKILGRQLTYQTFCKLSTSYNFIHIISCYYHALECSQHVQMKKVKSSVSSSFYWSAYNVANCGLNKCNLECKTITPNSIYEMQYHTVIVKQIPVGVCTMRTTDRWSIIQYLMLHLQLSYISSI